MLRDKTRDELADMLNAAGVKASLSDRERSEEKIGNKLLRHSLGIIDIESDGLIRFINIVKEDGDDERGAQFWFYLGVPGDRPVPKSDSVDIRTRRKKSFGLVGKVTGVTWNGEDRASGLANTLSDDDEIEQLAAKIGDIRVETLHDDFTGWSIEIDRKFEPTADRWKALEKIANISAKSIA
jgi:hypothetical protein